MTIAKALAIAIGSIAMIGAPAVAEAKGPRTGKGAKAVKLSKPSGWKRGRKTGWRGERTPPGWSKGRKTGWNGKKMPPGLFKRR